MTLPDLIKKALEHEARSFTIQTGLHPLVRSAKGVQTYDTERTTCEDVEALLRQLFSSRELREFRDRGECHFKTTFRQSIPLVGVATMKKDVIKDEMLVEFDINVSLQTLSA